MNSEKDEAPDFSSAPVWKILIGGNKLSRGYTIEGLTISYYRRTASTADTLMQMGRWFGFRPGYRDLVRIFLGVNEGKDGKTDLVSRFKEVCLMEERFREDIKRYVRRPNVPRITPKQIPPLISVTGNLPPTARNKMFYASIARKNFGGSWSQPTLIAATAASMSENLKTLGRFLTGAKSFGLENLGGKTIGGKTVKVESFIFSASNKQLIDFLNDFRWLESDYNAGERPRDVQLQIEFLAKERHGIDSWLIVAPQRKDSFGAALPLNNLAPLAVKLRKRVEGRGFHVFGEPTHRAVSRFLAGIKETDKTDELESANTVTQNLKSNTRGILLLYPVRTKQDDKVAVGFELLFPENDLQYDVHFTVRKKAEVGSTVQSTSK